MYLGLYPGYCHPPLGISHSQLTVLYVPLVAGPSVGVSQAQTPRAASGPLGLALTISAKTILQTSQNEKKSEEV